MARKPINWSGASAPKPADGNTDYSDAQPAPLPDVGKTPKPPSPTPPPPPPELEGLDSELSQDDLNQLAEQVAMDGDLVGFGSGDDVAVEQPAAAPGIAGEDLDLPDGDVFGTTADAYALLTPNQRRDLRDGFEGDDPADAVLSELDADLPAAGAAYVRGNEGGDDSFDPDQAPPALENLLREILPDVQRRAVRQPLNAYRDIQDVFPKLNKTPRERRQEEAGEVARRSIDVQSFEVEAREPMTRRRQLRDAQQEESDLQRDLDRRLQELNTIGRAIQSGEVDGTNQDLGRLGREYNNSRDRLGLSIDRERELLNDESDRGVNQRRQRDIDERLEVLDRADRRLGRGEPEEQQEREAVESGPERRDAPDSQPSESPRGNETGNGKARSDKGPLVQLAEDYLSGKLVEEIASAVKEKLRQE